MRQSTSVINKDKYITKVQSGNGNELIADEPVEDGGQNKGFAPGELLASALGACTCITLRMYADRKEWPLDSVTVTVSYERNTGQPGSHFKKEITLKGLLDDVQRQRLLQIAEKCPVNFTLTHPITVETIVV